MNIEDLKATAARCCIYIYEDYSEDEVKEESPAIQEAWKTGWDIKQACEPICKECNEQECPCVKCGGKNELC